MANVGVHSEVGKLRTVMVCRPGLAHQRLTPGNCKDLLFDDVLWVHEAQKDHYDFVLKMQERGVEVLELHDLLAETMENKEARKFVLDRRITRNSRGSGTVSVIRPWLDEMPAKKLAEHLIGGIAIADLPAERSHEHADRSLRRASISCCRRFRTRCSSAIRRAGSTAVSPSIRCTGRRANPKRCCSVRSTSSIRASPARRSGGAIPTKTSPVRRSKAATSCRSAKASCSIGMGERTTRQAVSQLAAALFKNKAATRVDRGV